MNKSLKKHIVSNELFSWISGHYRSPVANWFQPKFMSYKKIVTQMFTKYQSTF